MDHGLNQAPQKAPRQGRNLSKHQQAAAGLGTPSFPEREPAAMDGQGSPWGPWTVRDVAG